MHDRPPNVADFQPYSNGFPIFSNGNTDLEILVRASGLNGKRLKVPKARGLRVEAFDQTVPDQTVALSKSCKVESTLIVFSLQSADSEVLIHKRNHRKLPGDLMQITLLPN